MRVAFLALFLAPSSGAAKDKIDVRQVLLEFYGATGGSAWTNNYGWEENLDQVCDWHGVLCAGDDDLPEEFGREDLPASAVIGIDLRQNFLSGRSTDALWTLPFLQLVDLSYNERLEVSFAGLAESRSVMLHTLKLRSTATTSLAGLPAAAPSLREVFLSGLPLQQAFPDELLELTNLSVLHCTESALRGPIPADIGKLSQLRELTFTENSLTGTLPATLADLTNMNAFSVSRNKLSGSIPPQIIQSWTVLREAYFDHNDFSGTLSLWNAQPELFRLALQGNQFSGNIPAGFLSGTVNSTDLARAVEVDLSGNQLTGVVPSSLDSLSEVALRLNLANNKFTGVAQELCDNGVWNIGAVAANGCDGILCDSGHYHDAEGHATSDAACLPCDSNKFYGSTVCQARDDRSILEELYQATDGDSWKNRAGWVDADDSGSDFCRWYGVECWRTGVDRKGHVQKLSLPNNGLTNVVPESIFHLPYLQQLDLSRNAVVVPFRLLGDSKTVETINVAGTHTKDFGGMEGAQSQLLHLYADRLPIDGTLPAEIYSVKMLQTLSVAQSGLKGTLNDRLFEVNQLKELYLYGNELRGSIPSSVGQLQDLRILSLAKNRLTGSLPAELEQMPNLQALSLQDQVTAGGGITGELLAFRNSANLNSLLLGGNKIEGSIPDFLLGGIDLDSSVTLDLSNNRLNGVVTGNLARFKRMNIYLEGNELTGLDDRLCIMEEWMDGLVSEYECDAILCPAGSSSGSRGRQVFGNAPCQKCSDGEGQWLGQTQCGLDEEILTEQFIMERLYEQMGGVGWHVQTNWMSNAPVCSWHGITCDESNSITGVSLGANQLIGNFPTEVYQLPKLAKLTLFNNDINFSFEGIGRAENLHTLVLDSTGLKSLDGISEARGLKELDARFNKLSGRMPQGLSGLVNLESLVLSDNELTGDIPYWISMLPQLRTLKAANNRFTGTLYDFADMKNLVYVDLSNNMLEGPVPPTLLEQTPNSEKIVVELSNNRLSGTLPRELSRFSELSIHLADNKISGIDEELCSIGGWNDIDVREFGCLGILCPAGFANSAGRQTSLSNPCVKCDAAKYMGSTACNAEASSGPNHRIVSVALATSLLSTLLYIF
jgi:Leucine-rich repeat (LRR) protein